MLRASLAALGLGVSLTFAAAPAAGQSWGEESALPRGDCERACLESFVKSYVTALAAKDPSRAPFSEDVRFTENSMEMSLGEGLWGSVSDVKPEDGMIPADPLTGNVAWFGHAYEHGNLIFLAIRLHVTKNGKIDEAETVITRKTGMPTIFGTGQVPHDPSWAEPMNAKVQPPRSRLRAIADSYFSTVEYNDGTVFAPFHENCSRLENGISTTVATTTASLSASMAQGCENQVRLGIYRINKQLRERRYPLIDEERGIVVGTTFFDHANYFDEYELTDGRKVKTLLKWPNSLTIMEAFKIVDGKIYAIEANFDYVPYGTHSPWFKGEDD